MFGRDQLRLIGPDVEDVICPAPDIVAVPSSIPDSRGAGHDKTGDDMRVKSPDGREFVYISGDQEVE